MACPETTTLGRFVDGHLSPGEIATLEEHLDACEECFVKVSALAAEATGERTTISGEPPDPAIRQEFAGAIEALGYPNRASSKIGEEQPPTKIGRYPIEGILGQGAMGVVYRARDPETGRGLAIKTVHDAKAPVMSSLRQEIAFLRGSRHRGVVEILDYDLIGRHPWYAMELLEGETLADRNTAIWKDVIGEQGQRPGGKKPTFDAACGRLGEVLGFFHRLCEPLSFLHRAGVVHCDLKPANVFIRDGDQPVLMDFGLVHDARGMVGREALAIGRRRGTAYYMSPEVIAGDLPEHRADLYAFGCMLYESLTSRPPFLRRTQGELLDAHANCKPERASTLVNQIPPALDALIDSLLAKRPQDRIGHIDDVADALASLTDAPARVASSDRSARAAYLFRPRLVGRAGHVNEILERCDQALNGRGAMILLAGETGIGKTFLASEVSQRALLKGMRVLTGECLPVGADHLATFERSAAPLHPLRKVLEAVGDRWLEPGQERWARKIGPKLGLLAAYEPRLRTLSGDREHESPASLPGSAARERLLEAVTDVLAAMAEDRPLLLTIDDLQWVDDLSAAFLDSLEQGFFERTPVVILGTYRTDEVGETIRRIGAKPWVQNLTVGRLGAAEVQTVAGEMLAMVDPPRHLVDFLNAHSEGVPFFVAEYLRAVTTEGLLARKDGQWRLHGELSAISFPTNLAGLVGRRISALEPSTRKAVDAAAVLGREFELKVLGHMLGAEDRALRDSLQPMIIRQIAEEVRPDTYRFLHDAIRERTYAELDAPARANLHGRAADAMAHCHDEYGATDPRYAEIGHHFLAAGRAAEAMQFLEKAGEHALRISADTEAARYFQEALEIEARLPARVPATRRARWERQAADAEQGLGRMQESAVPLSRAAALLGWPIPTGKWRTGITLIPLALRQVLHRLAPDSLLGNRVNDSERLMEGGRVFDRLQRVYYYLGEDIPLLLANLYTLNLSEQARPSAELAMAYANAAAVAGILPAHKLADRYFALAVATLRVAPDPAVASYIEMLKAVHVGGIGNIAAATRHAESAISLAEQVGFFRRRDESLAIRVQLELNAGHVELASPWLERLDTSATRRGDVHMRCWAALLSAQRAILAGDMTEARTAIASVSLDLDKVGRPERIWAAGLEAYTAYRSHEIQLAFEAADRAAKLIALGPPAHVYCFDAYARVAEVRLALWEARSPLRSASDLARDARDACRVLLRSSRLFPIAGPAALLHEGSRRWIKGQRHRARRIWLRGRVAARRMMLPYYEARLDLALANTSSKETERTALADAGAKLLSDWKIVDGRDAQPAE